MPPDPAPGTTRRAISPLDRRVETATGHDIDTLWAYRDRGVLDESHARLVDLHRELAKAETSVTFYRQILNRLTSGEFPVDSALLARIDRAVHQLEEAAGERDAATVRVIAALEPIETAARATQPAGRGPLPAADQAALLAIAGGAKLHEHLLSGRMPVATASGTRIPYAQLQRLESAGLVSPDVGHPVHAGQPVALTDAGRAALVGSRSPSPTAASASARPGAWPPGPPGPLSAVREAGGGGRTPQAGPAADPCLPTERPHAPARTGLSRCGLPAGRLRSRRRADEGGVLARDRDR
jgi:hypothetical protein